MTFIWLFNKFEPNRMKINQISPSGNFWLIGWLLGWLVGPVYSSLVTTQKIKSIAQRVFEFSHCEIGNKNNKNDNSDNRNDADTHLA